MPCCNPRKYPAGVCGRERVRAGGALQLTIRLSHLLYAMTRFFRSLHICTLNVVQCNPMNTSLERFATLDFQRGQTVRALRHRKPTLTVGLLNVDNAWNTHSWCIHYPETYNNFDFKEQQCKMHQRLKQLHYTANTALALCKHLCAQLTKNP